MNTLFHRSPRLLVLTLLLLVVSGGAAGVIMPRAEDPGMRDRVARVVTRLPGASPERVEALVTEPLEQELLEIPELYRLFSDSRSGVSALVVQLADAVDDPAPVWSRIRDRLADVRPRLPAAASDPELVEEQIEAYTLIAGLAWRGDDPSGAGTPGAVDRGLLRRLSLELRDALRAAPGTDDVDLFGAVAEEVLVELEPAALATLGIGPAEVSREVAGSDAKVAAGRLRGPTGQLLVEVAGEVDSLARLRGVPLRQGADGRVVRLGEVARVTQGARDPLDELARIDGRPGVVVAARMARGQRVDSWDAGAQQQLEAFRARLPRAVSLETLFRQSGYTEDRLEELFGNLLLGVGLVSLVLFVLMGWRSALLVSAALPLTSLATLAGLRALGFGLEQMSITGAIIALGLLIDNAIVVVDELEALRRAGVGLTAAIDRVVRHLAVPLGASTLTTVLAFMPLVLLPGPTGEFVGSIGVSVILALTSSLFLSLTVLPALWALLQRGRPSEVSPGDASGIEGLQIEPGQVPRRWWRDGLSSAGLLAGYRSALDASFRRPLLGVLAGLTLPVLGFAGFAQLEEQFFPPADRDQLRIDLHLATTAPLERTAEVTRQASEVLRQDPQVEAVHWFVGRTAPKFYYNMLGGQDGAAHFAQAMVQLRSSDGTEALARRLQRRLDGALPEGLVVVRPLEQGPPFEAPVEVHLCGPDLDRLRLLGDELRGVLAQVPGVIHTRATLSDGQPKLWLRLDEEAAGLAGLDPTDVARQLDESLVGITGGSLLEETEELPIRVRVSQASGRDLRRLESLDVYPLQAFQGGARAPVPLSALGAFELRPQLARIPRRNGQRSNTVQGYVEAGVLPSRALAGFRRALEARGLELPPGYQVQYGGESEERDRAVTNLMASAGVLLVLMAASLVLAFDSFRYAALISTVGALSVGLGLGALWVFDYPFGFMAIVGTMGLVGVAINDAIVVLAALRDDPRVRAGDAVAAREVVVTSTRHVVATTLTTTAGFVPLIVAGGAFWRPLAVAIAGGVLGATLLALLFVPSAVLLLRLDCSRSEGAPSGA